MITERNTMRRTTSILTRIILLPIALFALAAAAAQGQIPQLLNYQGVLSDAARTAVPDGSYTVAFRIYDAPSGGVMLWEETQPVTTVDGIFEAILGARTPMALPFDAPYWLALELQGEPEMAPRIQFVSTPYAMNAMSAQNAQSAMTLDAAALDVVHTLNGLDGRLQIVGGGIATVTEAGSTISIVVPDMLPVATADGEVIRWNSVAGAWQALPITVETSARLSGDGSSGAPLDIAPMGASDGEALVWDAAANAWTPGRMSAATAGLLAGDGSTADPVTLADGNTRGQIILWNGTSWIRSTGAAPAQGEVLAWNATTNSWEPAGSDVVAAEEISGDGSAASPLRLAPQGAAEGEVLRWDGTANAWRPGPSLDALAPPFAGNGSPSDPLRLADGTNTGMLLYWNGTAWTRTAAVTPSNGWIMRWNAATTTWEPAQLSVTGLAALTTGSIWYGNASNMATELPIGTANQLLTVNGTAPQWTSDISVDTVRAETVVVNDDLQVGGETRLNGNARVSGTTTLDGDLIANDSAAFNGPTRFAQFPEIGLQENAMIVGDANDRASIVASTNEAGAVLQQSAGGAPTWSRDLNVDAVNVNTLDAAGDVTTDGNLIVNGTDAQLPDGSIGNTELANSSIDVAYGAGLNGDATVALGGTLNLTNTGVTSAIAGPGVSLDNATGAVTITNTGLLTATEGAGIDVAITNGNATITNTGLLAASAGTGIDITTTNGTATITNTGVTSVTGTPNQVSASAATGAVTLSLPQNIHTGASPTFTGATLTGLTGGSSATNFVVAGPGGILQTRTMNLLPSGTVTNATLVWDGTAWVENTRVTMNPASGDVTIGGNGDLIVSTGGDVILPNGVINNNELQNSSVTINTGTGLSGGGNVALGGTLNLANTGVTSAIAGAGVSVNNATGAVTITNTGLLGAAAGTGIGINTVNGIVTITNNGVTSITGTPNQVNASAATGAVTLSLPQNIHAGASPTFTGATLTGLTGGSSATNFVVAGPGGVLQTRTMNLLPTGTTTNATLVWNGTAWVENTRVTMNPATGATAINGATTITGATTVTGDLTVTGPNVNLPNGSVGNAELANSSVTINTGTGLSGGGNVPLGGTLNLANTGVTSAIAGAGVSVNNATGAVTITNTGLLSAAAGRGIGVNTVGGVVTITNNGVTSITGTPNQVNASASTGAVTLSLPQNIHTGASPTFVGATLTGLAAGTSNSVVVTGPGGVLQTRTINVLPNGTTTNATLVWNGTAWVENTMVTMNPTSGATSIGGDLTVTGPNVNLPNGSVGNAELANSSVTINTGAGLSGGGNVALGGTLNLANTGVTSAIAGTGINVDNATGAVTITNTGLLGAAAGTGIGVNTVAGVATITNTGVTQAIGTANQVIVSPAGGTGNVTFSLPQNIDQNATPTFNGVTLDALAAGSTANDLLVSNGGVVETRTVASVLAGLSGQFWNATGNAGTTPGTNFLGTTDAQAFQIHVDNANSNATNGRGRVMRFEPNNTSANIIGGFKSNSVGGANVGATIAGGGRSGNLNTITADYGVIGGGYGHTVAGANGVVAGGITNNIAGGTNNAIGGGTTNTVQTGTNSSIIAGGQSNTIQGSNTNSVIGGGFSNNIRFNAAGSVIAGGSNNMIDSTANTSVIGGGSGNLIDNAASSSTIAGGNTNTILSNTSVIGGGDQNDIGTNSRWSVITGGHNNNIANDAYESNIAAGEGNDIGANSVRSTVGGGSFNDIGTSSGNSTIAGGYGQGIGNSADRSTIGGGMSNAIRQGASISTIGGGTNNVIDTSANTSVIGGGASNVIDDGSTVATIGGGQSNAISGSADRSTIAGGFRNVISANWSTIGGGEDNTITALSATIAGGTHDTIQSQNGFIGGGDLNKVRTGATFATIAGGRRNEIQSGGNSAFIGGGDDQIVSGDYATVTGGRSNSVTSDYSAIAGGRGLTLSGDGSFGFLGNNNAGGNGMTVSTANTALFGNTDLWLANNDNSASALRFYEAFNAVGAFPSTANHSSFEAGAQTADIRYILPDTSGIVGDVLKVRTVAGSTVTLDWDVALTGVTNWTLTGNASTVAGTNFLGTTDDEPFQIHVDNANANGTNGRGRALRIEPNNFSPNIIGGFSGNTMAAGAVGSVIAGGGLTTQVNTIDANTSFIGGGVLNLIETGASQSVVAGGANNRIRNFATTATIGGGASNEIRASATDGTIGGGNGNYITATTQWATVAGGRGNSAGGHASSVSGGQANSIAAGGDYSAIGGGVQNAISGAGSQRSAIVGGGVNTVSAGWTTILGGQGLTLSGTSSLGFLANNTASTRDMSVSLPNVAVFGNNDLWLANNDNSASTLRFYEANSTTGVFPGTTNYSSFAAGAQTADIDYILPDTAGAVGDMLTVRSVAGTTVTLDWDAVAASASAWELTGNAGTTAGTDFLGTTDDEPFQIHVDNANTTGTDGRGRVMRYEPNATSANIVGGFSGNAVTGGATGATIAGGGENGRVNTIASASSVISGGTGNAIAANSTHSVVAGGDSNLIGVGSQRGVIGGGYSNEIGANTTRSTIAGGQDNGIGSNSFQSTIGGGALNRVGDNSRDAVIGGGGINWIGSVSAWGTISGGYRHYIHDSTSNATIAGGFQDTIHKGATYSAIGGGVNNSVGTFSFYAVIDGGNTNTIGASSTGVVIGGGALNVVGANALSSMIGGGQSNRIDSAVQLAAIGGGYRNMIYTTASGATIGGGWQDTIGSNSWQSVIGGGGSNVIRKDSWHSTISGGGGNVIDSISAGSVIAGGSSNMITGRISTIAGGRGLTLVGAGSFGFLGNNDGGTRDMTLTATNTAAFGNTDLWLVNNDNSASAMRFYEANSTIGAFPATVHHSSFEAGTQTADIRYILPDTAGIVGDVLSVRAVAGTTVTMDWAAAGGSSDWSRTGNAGTTPGTNFVGTTDAQAFQIHVDNGNTTGTDGRGRVMRYEPNATSANIIGGYSGNTIAGAVVAGTIAGGGQSGSVNAISSNYGTISGGRGNTIAASSINATIAGGVSNQVGTSGAAGNGTVSGGLGNVIVSGDHTTIGGGFSNDINAGAFGSTISGGTTNATGSHTTVIDGGAANEIGTTAQFSSIGGGYQNSIGNSAFASVIAGGTTDTIEASANGAVVSGGENNVIRSSANNAVIAGGEDNQVLTNADYTTIAGGRGLSMGGAASFGFLGNNIANANPMTVSTANTALFGNTDLWLANNDNAASELRFYEANATTGAFPGTANYTALVAGTQTADITYTLPTAAPTANGQIMASTTGGTMSWVNGPTTAQAFANSSSATASLELTNNEATNNDGVALRVSNGALVGSASTANQAGGTLPENKMIVRVADDGAGTQPAVTLPAAVDGTIIYLIVEDANGVNITNALAAGVDPTVTGVYTLIQYNNGTTSVWAVSR